MASENKSRQDPNEISDEELMRRTLSDPDVQARIRKIKAQIARGELSGPGIGP